METIRIRDPGLKKVGPGIREKHPGSATLLIVHFLAVLWIRIRMDLNWLWSAGSGSALGIHVRIQESKNDPKK
jgi:hypothetical protein